MTNDCFYSHDKGCEILTYETIDEAMEEYTQDVHTTDWPKEITIYRFERMPIPEKRKAYLSERAIESLIEKLDEEHGEPEGDGTEITNEMLAAAREFVDKVIAKYTVWGCEVAGEETVNVADWAEANLLPDDEVQEAITRLRKEASAG